MSARDSKTRRHYRILSLDGGGIRGLISAVWLRELEARLEPPVGQYFDLIAGTSTGAILACAISQGTSAVAVLEMYRDLGREVFPGTAQRLWNRAGRLFRQGFSAPKYDDQGLEQALRRQFGTTLFGELLRPTMVTSYDTQARQAVVMKTLGTEGTTPRSTEPWPFDGLPVWEIAKASGSAPTYFPAHVASIDGEPRPLIDGGVVANNPTACAIAEAVRLNAEGTVAPCATLEDFVVVSLGTGATTRPITIDEAQEWGAVEWAIPIIDVLFDGASDSVDYIARHLVPEGQYFRLQARLDDALDDLDDASPENIEALLRVANGYIVAGGGSAQLDTLAMLLRR